MLRSINDDEEPQFEVYDHQVSGTLPLLQQDGILYKPCFENEIRFYQTLAAHPRLQPYVSEFYGEELLETVPPQLIAATASTAAKRFQTWNEMGTWFLKLNCVTNDFHQPCGLDLKLGTQQHPSHAPAEKIRKSMQRCFATTSRDFGLRFCGIRLYSETSNSYVCWNKYEMRGFSADMFVCKLRSCFETESGVLRIDTCKMIIQALSGLEKALIMCSECRFYSSSLLIVFEGISERPSRTDVRLIDFNNSVMESEVGGEPDYGALFGVESLRRLLCEFCEENCGKQNTATRDWDEWRSRSLYAERARAVFDGFECGTAV